MTEEDVILSTNLDDLMANYNGDEGTLFILLCMGGRMQIDHDQKRYELKEDDLLICHPSFVSGNYMRSPDFKSWAVCIAPQALDDILYACMRNMDGYWDKAQYVLTHPIFHINHRQKRFSKTFSILTSFYAPEKKHPYSARMFHLLGQIAALEMLSWIDEVVPLMQKNEAAVDRKDILCRQFMDLLQTKHGTIREVYWFANQLAISPKYLSIVTKDKIGVSAHEMIQQAVCQEIKQQLLNTNDSIKEIAYRMNFSSTTFFCKYVRQHMGVSPQTFRSQR